MALAGYGIALFPLFYWSVIRPGVPILGPGPGPGPRAYLDALRLDAFPAWLESTVAIAAITITIALAAGVTVAYALARLPIRGRVQSCMHSWF